MEQVRQRKGGWDMRHEDRPRPWRTSSTIDVRSGRRASEVTVDLSRLEELLTMAGSDRAASLISLFLTETRLRLDLLHDAHEAGSLEDAAALCHRLKGAGGAFGAVRFGELAAILHSDLRSLGMRVLTSGLGQLEEEFEVLSKILEPLSSPASLPSESTA